MRNIVLGDEAVAQGALDAGVSGVYAYPGTPSTEITEYIITLIPQVCSLRKAKLYASIGVAQEKATQT